MKENEEKKEIREMEGQRNKQTDKQTKNIYYTNQGNIVHVCNNESRELKQPSL